LHAEPDLHPQPHDDGQLHPGVGAEAIGSGLGVISIGVGAGRARVCGSGMSDLRSPERTMRH
jgi:hypothetical protein